MLTVDVHNHFAPAEILAAARAGDGVDGLRVEPVDGREFVVHRQGFRWPLQPAFHDQRARLSAMDARGIDTAVVSLAPPLMMHWLTDLGAAADLARLSNDALAAFTAGTGGRLTGVATLPMQDPAAAVTELRRAVTGLGLRGAQIGPRVEDTPLDDPGLRPVLAEAARLRVPLLLHPYHPGTRPGFERFYLTNLVGNPLESTVGAAHLIFGGVLDELPGLTPVLMHGGGYLPYQIGRLDHGHRVRREASGCAHPPSHYLRRFHYDTLTHAPGPLRFLAGMVGADRIVYGTDFPYDMGGGTLAQQLDGTGLGEPEMRLIAGGNASRLFAPATEAGRARPS
ncbi:amidohydrolase family protein [Mangrovihabitans endophyticus]|uniref:Amidohydrolase n=1 Tax=Mangrovihabitans endophyticus TaxID=1751298 RepID=A0A8J3FQ75_9ACTN|nr:amidohydrolase family protein [Mangrovihabitans endophyticus]GGL07538.1 amidohydrolase [Mangrovihabitans endophyticus]